MPICQFCCTHFRCSHFSTPLGKVIGSKCFRRMSAPRHTRRTGSGLRPATTPKREPRRLAHVHGLVRPVRLRNHFLLAIARSFGSRTLVKAASIRHALLALSLSCEYSDMSGKVTGIGGKQARSPLELKRRNGKETAQKCAKSNLPSSVHMRTHAGRASLRRKMDTTTGAHYEYNKRTDRPRVRYEKEGDDQIRSARGGIGAVVAKKIRSV